nr:MAG TPA: acetyl-coA carboxylase zinc finger domain protein [Caudoviricetes sp.]
MRETKIMHFDFYVDIQSWKECKKCGRVKL